MNALLSSTLKSGLDGEERCHLCGCASSRPFAPHPSVRLLTCEGCGLVYNPRFGSLPAMEEFYEGYYGEEDLRFGPVNDKRISEILSRVEKRTGAGRVLDVGCGSGHLLAAAAARGWKVLGVEISDSALRHLADIGIPAFGGDLSEAALPSGSFDFVHVSEVIEHVLNPQELLQEISRILRVGGVLILTTPNFNSLSRVLLGTRWTVFREDHLSYFNPRLLRQAAMRAGLSILRLETVNINPYEIYQGLFRRNGDGASSGSLRADQQALRSTIEDSRALRLCKKVANRGLSVFGIGDTIKLEAVNAHASP